MIVGPDVTARCDPAQVAARHRPLGQFAGPGQRRQQNRHQERDHRHAAEIRARQDEYLADSDRVTAQEVAEFGVAARLWQNLLATVSPIL